MSMDKAFIDKLIWHINKKDWWHVPPLDPDAYRKRGKFLSSSFREAEFWGRPLDESEKVAISKPLVGDEPGIEGRLLGKVYCRAPTLIEDEDPAKGIEMRFALDARMKKAALRQGYDSIVLMGPLSFQKFVSTGKMPRSIELNILRP